MLVPALYRVRSLPRDFHRHYNGTPNTVFYILHYCRWCVKPNQRARQHDRINSTCCCSVVLPPEVGHKKLFIHRVPPAHDTRRRGTQRGIPSVSTRLSLSMEMSRLMRDGTAEPVSRDQILRRERGQENIHVSLFS